MPVYNVSLLPRSPFIKYAGKWQLGDANGYTITDKGDPVSSLALAFTGSAIYVHTPEVTTAAYNVTLDGNTTTFPATWGFPRVVFAQEGLKEGPHLLNISSTQFIFSEIDFTTGDGQTGTTSVNATIGNMSPNITYEPANKMSPQISPFALNQTFMTLDYKNVSANISFFGNEIALYTVLQTEDAVNYGAFNISLDGQSPQTWPGATPMTDQTSTDPMPNMLVYHSGALSTGHHHVVLTALEDNVNGLVSLDYATVRTYTVPDKPATNTSGMTPGTVTSIISSPISSAANAARSSDVAALAGGIVGGIVAVIACVTIAVCIVRRRYRRARLIFAAEDGIDGPRAEEADMPPPDYRRVFPRTRGSITASIQARFTGQPRAHVISQQATGAVERKTRRTGGVTQPSSRPIPSTAVPDERDHAQTILTDRNRLNHNRKGMRPQPTGVMQSFTDDIPLKAE